MTPEREARNQKTKSNGGRGMTRWRGLKISENVGEGGDRSNMVWMGGAL